MELDPESESETNRESGEAEYCSSCGTPYEGLYCARCGRARLDETSPSLAREPNLSVSSSNVPVVTPEGDRRRALIAEVLCVGAIFWLPITVSAITSFIVSRTSGALPRFPRLIEGHPLENMVLGAVSYATIAGVVPITLYLLRRTGDSSTSMGLGRLSWRSDVLSGLGLAAASFLLSVALADILFGIANHMKSVAPTAAHLPQYYVFEAIVLAATTALVEEVVMNGFLVTRLEQLGMARTWILVVAVLARTAYHSYYGAGMVFTIPFTIMVTQSFLKNRRLSRVIFAHFIYDTVLLSISVLVS